VDLRTPPPPLGQHVPNVLRPGDPGYNDAYERLGPGYGEHAQVQNFIPGVCAICHRDREVDPRGSLCAHCAIEHLPDVGNGCDDEGCPHRLVRYVPLGHVERSASAARSLSDLPPNTDVTNSRVSMQVGNVEEVSVLWDSGAEENFVDYDWARRNGFFLHVLRHQLKLVLLDGNSPARGGRISRYITVNTRFGVQRFLCTWLDPANPVVFGQPALRAAGFNEWLSTVVHGNAGYIDPAARQAVESMLGGGNSDLIVMTTQIPTQLSDFADVFSTDESTLAPTTGTQMVFPPLTGRLPPPSRPIRLSAEQQLLEQERTAELIRLNRVRPSSSSVASAMFFVRKACLDCGELNCTCGSRRYEQREVVDYRPINAITPQDAYPLPDMTDIRETAAGHRFYTKIDIWAAFHLIPIAEQDRHLTAFLSPSAGLLEWNVMPFGLKNAPAVFQRFIDSTLNPCRGYSRAFLDDILIWADTEEEMWERSRAVLLRLRSAGLRAKLRKCRFLVESVDYLGHVLSAEGISTDPAKTQGIRDAPRPVTKTDVRAFLGLLNYYREFVPNFAVLALPLYALTTNDQPSVANWTAACESAFLALKDAFSRDVILAVYDPSLPVELITDASTYAFAGVIRQNGRPLAWFSGKFNSTQQSWTTTDRELYAGVWAHQKYSYLLLGETIWYTDHEAITSWRTTMADNHRRVRWRETLDLFPFSVRFMRGVDMVAFGVDPLTRHSTWGNLERVDAPVLDAVRFAGVRVLFSGVSDETRLEEVLRDLFEREGFSLE
jgi:hypothetical protein